MPTAQAQRWLSTNEVLHYFQHVRKVSGGWRAQCSAPDHEDRKPSLSISEANDGRTLFRCRSRGCTFEEIIKGAGLDQFDLGPRPAMLAASGNGSRGRPPVNTWKKTDTYQYQHADGEIVYLIDRMERRGAPGQKPDKQFWPRRPDGKGGWIRGPGTLNGIPRVLYRLPELLKVPEGELVCLAEGEKAANAFVELGYNATCNSGGSKGWVSAERTNPDYITPLRGRRVAIFLDNDEEGEAWGHTVARSVSAVAISIKKIRLPGIPPKGDIIEYRDAGGTVEEINGLIENAPEWKPTETDVGRTGADHPREEDREIQRRKIFHSRNRKVEIQPAAPLVKGVAYRKQVTIVEGLAGSGKSHVAIDIAATASQRMRVLFVANESPEELDARLDAWESFHGLKTPQLYIIAETVGLFDLTQVGALIDTAEDLGGFDLILIDVLSNEFGAAGKDETNENMAAAFASTYLIARSLNCGVVVTTHTGWSGEHTRGGSQSYGSARRVLHVEQTDEVIRVKVAKANVRRDHEARRFCIIQVDVKRIEGADPKRVEEYTVLVDAAKIASEAKPLSARQTEVLIALAQPIFKRGAKFAEIETHTGIPKSTISTSINALMKKDLVDRSQNGTLTLLANGQELAQRLIEMAEHPGNQSIEPTPNRSLLNWELDTEDSSKTTSLMSGGSVAVQPLFNDPVPTSSFAPPSLGERTAEPHGSKGESGVPAPDELPTRLEREADYSL